MNMQLLETEYIRIAKENGIPAVYYTDYRAVNCFKDFSDKKIYLLEPATNIARANSDRLIIKIAFQKRISQLQQEYLFFDAHKEQQFDWLPELKDFSQTNLCAYLVRTYIDGPSLCDYYEKRMVLSKEEITDLSISIGKIICDLHSFTPPIIHRDIKPENFVRNKLNGKWYLIDFDTIRQFSPNKSRDTTLLGTPSQAAPEQFGYTQSDVRTDIFAFGKTVLYLCTGTTDETALNRTTIDPYYRNIIKKCVEFNPDDRYKNMSTVLRQFKRHKRFMALQQPAIYVLLAICMLIVGYSLGSTRNSFRPNNNPNPSVTQNNSTSDKHSNASNTTAQTSQPDSDLTLSLSEQAGHVRADFSEYRGITDTIIMDYYREDREKLAKDFEILLNRLSKEDALNKISGTDYHGYAEIPADEQNRSLARIIKDYLVYRDGILIKNKDDLSSMQNYIYNAVDSFICVEYSCLNTYATDSLDSNGNPATFEDALMDLLRCLTNAFDDKDQTTRFPW